ncbi:MAG: hypothetical protein M0R47_18985 [Methylobacter sp.]|uniref:hypothetical protein n=1 Tax=Methylobacter sp. TaxID=2051955 RepID=UPI0025EA6917|nr:hypothetical protein [Methylobacter sp.]MCK9622607.1 hypothetical protein [Methylobacter sp.]
MSNLERRRSTDHFEFCPRYDKHELTKEQMLDLVEMVAEKVLDVSIDKTIDRIDQRRNEQIGKMVTNKFYAVLGAVVFGLWVFLTKHGYLK